MTIKPKANCKICASRGQVNFWDSEKRGTYHKSNRNDLETVPCSCLINNYKKINSDLKPEFIEENDQLVIKLVENEETEIETSEDDIILE